MKQRRLCRFLVSQPTLRGLLGAGPGKELSGVEEMSLLCVARVPGRGRGLGLCREVVCTREEEGRLLRAWARGTFPKGREGAEDGWV